MYWTHNFNESKSPCRVNQGSASIDHHIYSFGGYCQQKKFTELKNRSPIDVNILNTITFKWRALERPTREDDEQYAKTPYYRYGHSCVAYDRAIYLFGGRADWSNNLDNELYKFDPSNFCNSNIYIYIAN